MFEIFFLLLFMHVPVLQDVFGTAPIGWESWIFLFCIPPIILMMEEIRKAFSRKWAEGKIPDMNETVKSLPSFV